MVMKLTPFPCVKMALYVKLFCEPKPDDLSDVILEDAGTTGRIPLGASGGGSGEDDIGFGTGADGTGGGGAGALSKIPFVFVCWGGGGGGLAFACLDHLFLL